MNFNYLAPAGTPITLGFIVKHLIFSRKNNLIREFRNAIKQKFGVEYCFLFSTGRGAMTLLLQQLAKLNNNERKYIIIPAYTCYSVPASIINAGFIPRLCDINLDTLSLDINALKDINLDDVFAIVTSNLYGIPDDLPALEKFAQDNDLILIDDAAQSMGSKVNGRFSGTFGTAGIYSLDKGKNITTMNGGIIVTQDPGLASLIEKEIKVLPKTTKTSLLKDVIKLVIYSILLKPTRYWLIRYLPFAGLGKTIYTTEFQTEQYSELLARIGLPLLSNLDSINEKRVHNANYLVEKLSELDNLILPNAKNYGGMPVYLRLPVIFPDTASRDVALNSLNDVGICATTSYPLSLKDVPELNTVFKNDKIANGREIAKRILTLPTHPYTQQAHLKVMISAIKKVMASME